MGILEWFGAIVSFGLLIYLFIALLVPEKLS